MTEPAITATISLDANTSAGSSTNQGLLIESHSSSSIAVSPDGNLAVAVNPDSDSITLIDVIPLESLAEISVGDNPRTVSITPDSTNALVTNYDSATLSVIDLIQAKQIAQYSVGHMPYGVVTNGVNGFITEFGIGNSCPHFIRR